MRHDVGGVLARASGGWGVSVFLSWREQAHSLQRAWTMRRERAHGLQNTRYEPFFFRLESKQPEPQGPLIRGDEAAAPCRLAIPFPLLNVARCR
jgi:hypothetical protein